MGLNRAAKGLFGGRKRVWHWSRKWQEWPHHSSTNSGWKTSSKSTVRPSSLVRDHQIVSPQLCLLSFLFISYLVNLYKILILSHYSNSKMLMKQSSYYPISFIVKLSNPNLNCIKSLQSHPNLSFREGYVIFCWKSLSLHQNFELVVRTKGNYFVC